MMANWDKLNKEFDQLLDNMSAEDWNTWAANKESRKAMRRLEIELHNGDCLIESDKIETGIQQVLSF